MGQPGTKPGHRRFIDAIRAAGGEAQIKWATKRPLCKEPRVFYVGLYGRLAKDDKTRPFWGHVIINEFDQGGFEVFFESDNMSVEEDVAQILGGLI